jgi:hypothetical protein
MTTEVLGKYTFSETPDVLGADVLLNSGGVPAILSDITANRPTAGTGPVGRIFLDTTLSRFYRDNGASWDDLTPVLLLDGTANQTVVVDGTNVTPSVVSIADNPIIPGTGGMVIPVGTTAQRGASTAGNVRQNSTLAYAETYNGTVWQPLGRVLQVVSGNIAAQTATNSQTPLDATTPLSTEGTQIWTTSVTPISASSRLVVSYSLTHVHATNTRTQITALFNGTTNIGSMATICASGGAQYNSSHQVVFSPGSTATITISCRVGSNGNGTWYINSGATNTLGGSMVTQYTIMEIL